MEMALAGPAPPASPARAQKHVLHNVQVLRFIAAVGVLCSHTVDLLIPHNPRHAWFWAVPWTSGINIFFVISGFIMVYLTHDRFGDAQAARSFLSRRVIRIVPAYWFFTSLMVVTILLFGQHVKNSTVDGPQLLTSYGFIPWPRGDGKLNPILSQGWTLNYEAFFYICFAGCMLMRRGLWLLAGGFLLLAALHPFIPNSLFMLRFWSDPLILEFLGGAAIALIHLSGRRFSGWGSAACIALAIATFLLMRWLYPGPLGRIVQFEWSAILLCAGVILTPEPTKVGAIGKLLQYGGDASYTIYLSHTFTVNAVILAWHATGLDHPWAAAAIAMTAAIVAAMLFYRFAERPFTGLLQRSLHARRIEAMATVAP